MSDHSLNLGLLGLMLAATVWTVLTSDLMRSAIGLAVTSVILTLLLFRLEAPLAGVFELSVCAGLITVVFISTISLTKPLTDEETRTRSWDRWKRFGFLPVILLVAGWLLSLRTLNLDLPAAPVPAENLGQVQWFARRFDLIGQILVILAGIFGVVVLFKTKNGTSGEAKP